MPELAESWLCQWAECEAAHAGTSFSQPQAFYSHVTSHAEVRVVNKTKYFRLCLSDEECSEDVPRRVLWKS